jgi:uncharacterized surface protein with fasciclin (FAS1) repeats
MACHTVIPLLLFLPSLLAAAADDVAPAPAPAPAAPPEPTNNNLTSILENGGQYTTLLRLLNATRITEQISSQLKNSYDGLTFFAPNDNAFAKLKAAGTLNALADQDQIQLLLYHVLPRYYSLATFQTASNPLHTEASGPAGMYSVNVTASTTSPLVNLSTGVVDVPISSTLFARFPFAVYSVDSVLLPPQMFHTASSAPAPGQSAEAPVVPGKAAPGHKGGVPKSGDDVAAQPSAAVDGAQDTSDAADGRGSAAWMTPAVVLGGMALLLCA